MNTPIPYNCKICRKHFEAAAYSECPTDWVGRLKPLLTCNPCYDARMNRSRLERLIVKTCFLLISHRILKKPTQSNIRDMLVELSQKYSEAVRVEQGRRTRVWSSAFPELLFERPDEVGRILGQYMDSLRNEEDGEMEQAEMVAAD